MDVSKVQSSFLDNVVELAMDAAKQLNLDFLQSPPPAANDIPQIFIKDLHIVNLPPTARFFVRLAAISGTIAAIMCTYGLEVMYTNVPVEGQEVNGTVQFTQSYQGVRVNQAFKENFEMANRHHFIHTLALLAIPFCRWPKLTGALMTGGIVVFCGSCYYHAFTGNKDAIILAPYGGYMLMLAWMLCAL